MSQTQKEEMSTDVPEHCPGTDSENAGKSSACEGCPNKQICASSTPKGPDPDIDVIAERLQNVKHKLLILSGKGGVGKSTVTSMIARGLARNKDLNIGVLDIDLCGPSLPRVFGVEGEQIHHSGSGWSPIYVEDNLALMSAGFLLPSLDSAVIWRGPKKNGLIKQLLRDVDWDKLDFLLIDTPPGTSDEHISIVQFMSKAGIDGAIMVTTPQDVAILDVKKEINFCHKVNLPILGMVENMSGFVCPKCKIPSAILPNTGRGVEKMCLEHNISLLGKIPLNAMIGKSCDEGSDLFEDNEDSLVAKAFDSVIQNIMNNLNE